MTEVRYLTLAEAEPDEVVVVIDVLRAFTLVPWLYHRGADRVVAVATRDEALGLRASHLPTALLAGEEGGRPYPDFDLGNSPSEARERDLSGAIVVHRTSAGTQGLDRTRGSGLVLAASLVTAGATARALAQRAPERVSFIITGASLGRDGDEDLAAAELIAARMLGEDPDPTTFVARVVTSDAGRGFAPDGPDWWPPADLALGCEVDRFDHTLEVVAAPDLPALDVRRA